MLPLIRSCLILIPAVLLLVHCVKSGNESSGGAAKAVKPAEVVLYNRYCKGCHGKDGTLQLGGASNLKKSELSEPEMIRIITKGKGSMAAYESMLTEKEIEMLAEYVKGFRKN